MKKFMDLFLILAVFHQSLEDCPEEYSRNGIRVKWGKSPTAFNVESDPLCMSEDALLRRNCTDEFDPVCFRENSLVRRNCTDYGEWSPAADDVEPCVKVIKFFDLTSCPPGFHKISENNTDYCYKISSASSWNFPCFTSGGASVITDLDEDEIDSLIDSLVATNQSRYFWLPAQRQKVFNPVVWFIPGPNWGKYVNTNEHLKFQNLFWKNCLVLDVELRLIITDSCAEIYPSLCFYINNIHYPAVCPEGYHAFRYKPDNGTCFGIEKADSKTGLSFNDFTKTKCKKPMSDNTNSLHRFIFTKIAELNGLPDNAWCWFKTLNDSDWDNHIDKSKSVDLEGIINNIGTLGLINSSSTLPCIACEAEVIYGQTELIFEYSLEENKIYLTIYFPSGLWKYNYDDKGIQCFSDAKGFVKVVNISNLPYMLVQQQTDENNHYIEKTVYTIDLVTDRSAQYWCEGHTFNFSLISTDKIIVNPKGKEVHVFSLTLICYNITNEVQYLPDIDYVLSIITETLNVQKVLLMDILELTNKYITVLLHVHAAVAEIYEDEVQNIVEKYNNLKKTAMQNLPFINCTFVNLTSSVYCLPTNSNDYIALDWELTTIGHISAPKQFCLQSNGLPVKRQCQGSYHVGGMWGPVEGQCDSSYMPSETTTFLYNIVKGHAPNYTARFLTDGLSFVLSDVGSIIPADIYYLSMSLQEVLNMAQKNETCVDIGDIQNIAWVMDRVLNLDCDYMRLAQTLNSTNVILNSVNNIIEMIASENVNKTIDVKTYVPKLHSVEHAYQLAVKPQFIVQISYPELSNVTGIAIHKVSPSDKDMVIKPLYANTSLDDVLTIENLEVATWLPARLLMSLKLNNNETEEESIPKSLLHVIISIFQNDVVFQELKEQDHLINSRIVGVSIPGHISNLKYPLPIVFRQLNQTKTKKMCSFWDFQSTNSAKSLGLWQTKGCYPVKSVYSTENFTICECYHLTHFSQLISIPANTDTYVHNSQDKRHAKALNTITLVGCFLSLLGIIGIWITAMVFSNWRRKAGTKVLLQLSTAIALPLVFIVISNIDDRIFVKVEDGYIITEKNKPACIVLGALLHYSILASFMWMLITAVLQFVRYVRVLGVSRPSRFMFKFALIGWGIPLIPVIVVLSTDFESYVPSTSTYKPLCYPKGYYFILGIMLPICIILLVNVILFILVLYSISRGSNEKMKPTDMDLVGAQLRLSIFLFFLLGLTWIFGIFSFTSNLIWSYLFCLTATLQGFVLFIYFIVCDPATRNMWIALVKPPFNTNSSRNSITSISS
ncbi:Uncharacterized protein OBRU01_02934 [Operophtera brumata]|uniref:G-protein coupled receptors family 2 profile 2 domain-containing protein n=1 Tax=Operophtera brumata TaxID=104452 RepID=A0A0L7LMY0_OPEBR|nr:Uncharacterized protein OBRU01_02934 [Operophtera brumata]